MSDLIDPITPRRWIPDNDREQAIAEEVVQVKRVAAGRYYDWALDNLEFRYEDRREQQWYSIKFEMGIIYLTRM